MEEEFEDSEIRESEENSEEERSMHDAVCSECGKKCKVPFKPDKEKPVYCKECYMAKRPKKKFRFQRRTFARIQERCITQNVQSAA